MPKNQTARALAADGMISTTRTASIAGVRGQTLRKWVRDGVAKPTHMGEGPGVHWRWNLRHVAAVCAVAELREQGVSYQMCCNVQEKLRAMGDDWASAKLLAYTHGRLRDVLVLRPQEYGPQFESILRSPGQQVLASVALSEISKTVRERFAAAREIPAAIRGRKAKAKRGKLIYADGVPAKERRAL